MWIVAEFNAWRNQHINPPWWPLYVNMYNEMKKKFNIFKRIGEWHWRLTAGRFGYVITFVIVFWFIAIAFHFFNVKNTSVAWAGIADEISKIVALITTLAGGVVAFTQSLNLGSARAAKSFEEYAQNPMNAIRDRFTKLLNWLPKNVRLVVTIDDLDRCTSDYVVALLEGIQTLYRQGNIVFIIAADKKWINACFEEKYANLSNLIKEPGKPLGTLFLEKTFQLCTPVPGIPKELKKDLWKELISLKPEKIMSNVEEVENEVHNSIKDTKEDSVLIKKVNESKERPIHEQIAIRSEVVVHLASPGVLQRTEHTLKPFAPLLDDNPRAMKRFVNAYSVNRALSTLSFSDIELNDLAQWTILSMRWPLLAEYLCTDLDLVNKLIKNDLTDIDSNVIQLIKSDQKNIKKVINDSEGIGFGPLTKEIVEKCIMLS
jgi:hypothetical protein